MSDQTSTEPQFDCAACGRQFTWRAQIAGKAAKCKCGATVQVPTEAPVVDSDVADLRDLEGLEPSEAYGVAEEPLAPEDRCPVCAHALAPGAVLCVNCGFNLQTRQKLNTATGDKPAIAAAPAVPANRFGVAPTALRTPVMREEGSQLSAILKPAALLVILLLVVGGAIFGFRKLSGGGDEASKHEIDQRFTKMNRDMGGHELKAWLADNERQQRMVMGMNERQGAGFADKLYKMGAVQVLAFGPLMTLHVGVELPADPAQRKSLFQFQSEWHTQMGIKPQTDEGQKYMILQMRV